MQSSEDGGQREKSEIHHPAAFSAAGMGCRRERLLRGRRSRIRLRGTRAIDGRQVARQGWTKVRRLPDLRKGPLNCACHWTVNVAASNGHGKLWADVYSVAPAGIFVPHDSPIHSPEALAGVPISFGYQSGSHYSSIQALEQYLPADKISLSFTEGMLFKRLDSLLEGKSKASTLFSGPYYLAEQLGYRKIIDTTFMIASMITGTPDEEDLKRFFRALKRAQRDIDLRPELYTHYYKKEFPARYHGIMDTRRWGHGERIVFEPYTAEAFAQSRHWIAGRGMLQG